MYILVKYVSSRYASLNDPAKIKSKTFSTSNDLKSNNLRNIDKNVKTKSSFSNLSLKENKGLSSTTKKLLLHARQIYHVSTELLLLSFCGNGNWKIF